MSPDKVTVDASDGFVDFKFPIVDFEVSADGEAVLELGGDLDSFAIRIRFHLQPGMLPNDFSEDNVTVNAYADGITMSLPEDGGLHFAAALARLYGVQRSSFLLPLDLPFTAVALEGNPAKLASEIVKFKLFHETGSTDEDEGPDYFEMFLNIDLVPVSSNSRKRTPTFGLESFFLFHHGRAKPAGGTLRNSAAHRVRRHGGVKDFTVSSLIKPVSFICRTATRADVPALNALIEQSIRGLQVNDYTPEQIAGAIGHTLGLDTQLIADETYFVAVSPEQPDRIIGCGGWSYRRTTFGSDHANVRDASPLDSATEAAKIRAIFVHPDYARRGLGTLILRHCEQAAQSAGFKAFEMGSTLTGVPLYTLKGYRETQRIEVPLPNGASLPIVLMRKVASQQDALRH